MSGSPSAHATLLPAATLLPSVPCAAAEAALPALLPTCATAPYLHPELTELSATRSKACSCNAPLNSTFLPLCLPASLPSLPAPPLLRPELSDMRKKADTQKREAAETATAMASIEAAAQAQYEADLRAAAELKRQTLGEWVFSADTGYYYNAVQRWYYDTKSGEGWSTGRCSAAVLL